MKNQLPLLISIILIVGGCLNPIEQKGEVFDLKEVTIEKSYPISELFTDVTYISIDSSMDFELAEINKLVEFDNKIFILDRFQSKVIQAFNLEGKHLFQVGKQGRGPGEYHIPYDFIIDKQRNEINILIGSTILRYDLTNGIYKESKNLSGNYVRFEKNIGYYAFVGSELESNLIITNNEFEQVFSYFPFKLRNAIKPHQSFHRLGESLLFHLNFEDIIYKIDGYKVSPYLEIDFGKDRITPDDEKLLHQPQDIFSKLSNRKAICNLFYESRNNRILGYIYKGNFFVVISSKESGNKKIFNINNVINDITFESTFPAIIGLNDNDEFYAVVDAYNLSKQDQMQMDNGESENFILAKFSIKPF